MSQQYRILGWILLVLGIIGAFAVIAAGVIQAVFAYGISTIGTSVVNSSPGVPHLARPTFLSMVVGCGPIAIVLLLGLAASALDIVAGAGLLGRRPWALAVTRVASILSLPGVPFWTALGVYGLWLTYSADGMKGWQEYISG